MRCTRISFPVGGSQDFFEGEEGWRELGVVERRMMIFGKWSKGVVIGGVGSER